MSMSKRASGEVGLAGAVVMFVGSALATTGSESTLLLAVVLALVGVVFLGVGLVIAGHTTSPTRRQTERIPDELNAF